MEEEAELKGGSDLFEGHGLGGPLIDLSLLRERGAPPSDTTLLRDPLPPVPVILRSE